MISFSLFYNYNYGHVLSSLDHSTNRVAKFPLLKRTVLKNSFLVVFFIEFGKNDNDKCSLF